MNGLPSLANNLAAQGRYGDSMLMHVTPGEVRGLQALAQSQGTSLTTNPATGLPEAFKLKQLLPTLIGAGLSFIPGVGPLMAAGLVGGAETIRTGDLGKGLMAGLGAYGGAGLGAGLTSAGAAAGSNVGNIAAQQAVDAAMPIATAPTASLAAQNASLAGQGLQSLGTTQGWSNLGTGLQAAFPSTTAKVAAATPLIMGASEAFAPKVDFPTPEDPYANYKGPQRPTERQVMYPDEDFVRSSREFRYFDPSNPMPFARGGSVPQLEDGGFVLTKKAVDGLGNGDNSRGQAMASRGLGAIPIKGKGHGTSDSIKTSIDGKVPARVSNGEAYVPRRAVNKAGGADKLYALMRKAERRA